MNGARSRKIKVSGLRNPARYCICGRSVFTPGMQFIPRRETYEAEQVRAMCKALNRWGCASAGRDFHPRPGVSCLPLSNLPCYAQSSAGSTSRRLQVREKIPNRQPSSRSSNSRLKANPPPSAEMDSELPNLSDYVSGANVPVAVTSLLPNGRNETLEEPIFNGERMGILVSFCIEMSVLLMVAHGCRITRFSSSPPSFP